MSNARGFSAFGISVVVHTILLFALAMIQQNLLQEQPEIQLETVFDDERVQEEFSQQLEVETEVAQEMNAVQAGSVVSAATGGSSAPAVRQQKIETSESLEEPNVQVNVGALDLPGENIIGTDLGPGEVSGEVGAFVEGYGAALGRMTQELIRMMRESKVMVVWLFDESESMKDDQKEIAQKFHKVYEELGIQSEKDDAALKDGEVLSTVILGFGESIHTLTQKPTSNVNEIRAAIDKIAVDASGIENMCQSISAVIDKYGPMAVSQKRRLVLVLVTDESPSDAAAIEDAVQKSTRAKAPIYILGREAIFGYPYARIVWKDPVYNLNHWVWIDRGPETAEPEQLQYDGFRARHDSFSSGFGPYSQVRICKETGGIFFVLPGEEQNLTGAGANLQRQFDALNMREYEPGLGPAREYLAERQKSEFRATLWNVIATLNPRQDRSLEIRWWLPVDPKEFDKAGKEVFERVTHSWQLLNQAVALMEKIKPLRDKEASQRWRANYDLISAQLRTYRFRQFQYLLALDQVAKNGSDKIKDPKSNWWHYHYSKEMIQPTDEQFAQIKKLFNLKSNKDEWMKEMEAERQTAEAMFQFVEEEHPGTPWSQRAAWERSQGYGIVFREHFHDPRYNDVGNKIKIPKF